jgi:KDO2-lipid IV(A) lauroyltransferase
MTPDVRCWLIPPLVLIAKGIARLPQSLFLALGRVLTFFLWPLLTSRRRIARINLALCFPELDDGARRKLLRANMRSTVIGALELLRAWYALSKTLHGLADIDGLDRLQNALAEGHGVLLFTGHFTHTELAVRLISEALGRPVRTVIRRHNSVCLETAYETARAKVFGPTIAKKDVRGLLRALQSGEAVTYSADQNFTYQAVFAPFFGVPAATLTSTSDLVRRSGTRVLPLWFFRDEHGRYQIEIAEPWSDWPSADRERDAVRYMQELEQVVRRHPEQYLWVHRRFKTRPEGMAPVY